eukprot:SAG31_NODE_237_length_19590_cov_13.149915_11_plen_45_part_00
MYHMPNPIALLQTLVRLDKPVLAGTKSSQPARSDCSRKVILRLI